MPKLKVYYTELLRTKNKAIEILLSDSSLRRQYSVWVAATSKAAATTAARLCVGAVDDKDWRLAPETAGLTGIQEAGLLRSENEIVVSLNFGNEIPVAAATGVDSAVLLGSLRRTGIGSYAAIRYELILDNAEVAQAGTIAAGRQDVLIKESGDCWLSARGLPWTDHAVQLKYDLGELEFLRAGHGGWTRPVN